MAEGSASLERLCEGLQRSADEERRRLARQLHDSASQTLAAASMRLSLLESEAGLSAPAREELAHAQRLIAECVRELNDLSHVLHPPLLGDRGLSAALRALARRLGEPRLRLELVVPPPLAPPVEVALYRLAEQALAGPPTPLFAESAPVTAQLAVGGEGEAERKVVSLTLEGQPHGEDGALTLLSLRQRCRALGGSLRVRRAATLLRIEARLPVTGRP
jgi:signal transduction histidine kinase